MDKPVMPPLDAVLWRWTDLSASQTLASAITQATAKNNNRAVQVTFETVFIETGHPFDFIHPRAMLAEERGSAHGVQLLKLMDRDGPWVLAAFKTQREGVFHLVSGLPATHARWKRVERWISAARGVSRCFLNHADFESIGDRLSEFGDVEVVKMSGRVIKDGSSVNRGFPMRTSELRPSHIDVIEEVESRDASVRTLTLHVDGVMSIHIRRVAGATFYSGNFGLFEEFVLSRLADAAGERRALMTGRQRRPREPVKALTINLDRDIMESPDDTAHILTLIGSMADVSMAVFHRNPYLHLTITDEGDGSNFDVLVTKPNAIDIFPGYRASMASLARVAHRLGERFGASSIADAPTRQRMALADLEG